MRVDSVVEQLLFSTVRIDTRTSDGAAGSGTGFIYIHESGGDLVPVVVTNKHVVANCQDGWLTFTQSKEDQPDIGTGYRLHISDF